MRTRDKLAAELRKIAGTASYENAQKYEAFAKRAATGEFDDYSETWPCPITQLHTELTKAGFTKFAQRVADGEFDASAEESAEWADSPEGQATLGLLRGHQPHTGGLGDAPIQPDLEAMMNQLARFVDDLFNPPGKKETGFVLLVFPFLGKEGRCNYISNASREDVVIMLKEQIARFEGQPEVVGHA